MCGFLSVYSPDGGIKRIEKKIEEAGELLAPRGPDSRGSYFDDFVGFYFRRLQVIYISDQGNQPFISDDGNLVLVFNGELFNYKELRSELSCKGIRFTTDGDTEVLLRCFEYYGPDCVEKFRGMFAFAVWNKRERRMTLVRDRFGIKPLYILKDGSKFIAASEIKSILSLVPKSRELNEHSVYKFVTREFSDDTENTFYTRIKSVKPGRIVQISHNDFVEKQYWQLSYSKSDSFDSITFREKFQDAMKYSMVADVPIAVALSGGLDSSAVLSVANDTSCSSYPINSFTVVPPDTYDESDWINFLVREKQLSHEYVQPEVSDMGDVVDQVIQSCDEPFMRCSYVYQNLLRKHIGDTQSKVVLVGSGADEVLAGYRRMIFTYLCSLYSNGNISEFMRALKNCKNLFSGSTTSQVLNYLKNYIDVIEGNKSGQENTSAFDIVSEDAKTRYPEVSVEPLYINDTKHTEETFFELLINHIFKRNLPYVLKMEDRNSAASGIEGRVPFLDHKFVEFAFSHSYYEFMRDGQNKSMLRRAMHGILPSELLSRQFKTNAPGNHVHFVYQLLKKDIVQQLERTEKDSFPLWRKNLKELFLQDQAEANRDRAESWLRVYTVERWRELYSV